MPEYERPTQPMALPTIPCIAIISKQNTPLYIHHSQLPLRGTSINTLLDLHLLVHTTLDVFDLRLPQKTSDQDFGLLFVVDERLSAYGWMTNTGVKFVVLVDQGNDAGASIRGNRSSGLGGVRESDMKPVFKAVHTAYIQLISNPFYDSSNKMPVKSTKLRNALQKIAEAGIPGLTVQ